MLPYLVMSHLDERTNPLWPLLTRTGLTAAARRPPIASRRRRGALRRRRAAPPLEPLRAPTSRVVAAGD